MVIRRPSAILKVTVTSPSAQLLDLRGDADLEVALRLVEVLELVGGAVDLDRVVHGAQLEVDLLEQGGRVLLLVAREEHVADEGPLGHHVGELDAALEVLHPDLDVVEEAEGEDGPDVLGGAVGDERGADLEAHAPQDHRLLDPAVTLDRDLLDEDRPLGGAGGACASAGRGPQEQGKKNGESASPPSGHQGRAVRVPGFSVPPAPAGAPPPGLPGRRNPPPAHPPRSAPRRANCPRTMASASGSSTCFWIVRRSCRAP